VKHFSEHVWTDFVRGIELSKTGADIEAHLLSGCTDCVASVAMWKKVATIAKNEPGFAPSDDVVRMAKFNFNARQTQSTSGWTLATLVFDSLNQPLTAGVRSGASDARQLMYDAEGTMVDLVLEALPQTGTMSLVGQVVDKQGTRIAPRRVTVTVWTETGQPSAEASGNQFGEFQLEFAAQNRIRLSVEIEGHQQIRIPPVNLRPKVTKTSVTDESRSHY
jgi:hypothetical protein